VCGLCVSVVCASDVCVWCLRVVRSCGVYCVVWWGVFSVCGVCVVYMMCVWCVYVVFVCGVCVCVVRWLCVCIVCGWCVWRVSVFCVCGVCVM